MNYVFTQGSVCLQEKAMATYSSILAWRIPWTEEPGGLLSTGLHRVRQNWSDLACMRALEKEMATHSSILVWRISGTEEPGRLQSMESQRIRHNWVTNTFSTYREPIYEMYAFIKYINKYKHTTHQCSLMRSYKNPGKSDTQSGHNMNWTWKIPLTYLVRAVDLGTILQ